jgi:hypothetical protein
MAAWTFVALDRFADRDYYRYAYDRPRVANVINNTTNITNYVTVNNRIVNRSINVDRVERGWTDAPQIASPDQWVWV